MNDIRTQYFDWLCGLVAYNDCDIRQYSSLFQTLYEARFEPVLEMDRNREDDGINLRYAFARANGWAYEVVGEEFENCSCSMLEMMVAISIRLDQDFLYSPEYGNRAGEWFWMMIYNMGLSFYEDDVYDELSVHIILKHFINREYSYNGSGGLFIVNTGEDMTKLDIWSQACRFADSMLLL